MTDKEMKKIKSVKTPKIEVGGIKKGKILKILLAVFLILFTSTIFYFLYKGYKATKDFGFQFTPGQIIEKKKDPELKKDSTGKYTNVLIVGIDTRENTKLLNTDVIIVGSYNHETKDIVMISVPRDFHAQTNLDKLWFNKINSTYMVNEQKLEGSGLPVLEQVVEGITGLEIQYHAMINFNGFVELIDAVGG
ncbi:MAG: LCP family protein, partial [Candidatus Dojkabacteria bacterium]|nr:LCP family protein [Candidatus Dojkabacteria bacterium]